jgi:hypothetical protein
VTETQAHGCQILSVQTVEKRSELTPNTAEEVERVGVGEDIDAQLFVYGPTWAANCIGKTSAKHVSEHVPIFVSTTTRLSLPLPFSTTCSCKNCLSPFPSFPSWMAVISSTAVAVDVNR